MHRLEKHTDQDLRPRALRDFGKPIDQRQASDAAQEIQYAIVFYIKNLRKIDDSVS